LNSRWLAVVAIGVITWSLYWRLYLIYSSQSSLLAPVFLTRIYPVVTGPQIDKSGMNSYTRTHQQTFSYRVNRTLAFSDVWPQLMLTLLISRPGCRLAMSMSCLLQETWLSVCKSSVEAVSSKLIWVMNKLFNTYPKTHRVTSNSLMHGKRFCFE
jgi:hypothetical protein